MASERSGRNAKERLVKLGMESRVLKLEKDVLDKINKAIFKAKNDPFPNPKVLYFGVYDYDSEK